MTTYDEPYYEPWTIDHNGDVFTQEAPYPFLDPHKVRRAVACVNACRGLSDEHLQLVADNKAIIGVVKLTEGRIELSPNNLLKVGLPVERKDNQP